jgi:hypothetical protein
MFSVSQEHRYMSMLVDISFSSLIRLVVLLMYMSGNCIMLITSTAKCFFPSCILGNTSS